MSKAIQQYIKARIAQRHQENNFRSLKLLTGLVDFYSNDYLGFAHDKNLKTAINKEVADYSGTTSGSTGSRLLSGNSAYAEELEKMLAKFHHAPVSLLLNSGFDANYGLLSALPYRGDTIIYDELVHASIHDGIKNSKAEAAMFSHNNLQQLEEKLSNAKGLKYVVVESVYSMDGDLAPLKEIATLCEKYDAGLIVDEAHATGVFGPQGEGRVVELKLEDKCLARVHTFGKAIGAHGAIIVCSEDLKNFLINYCRPFIFSTALPFHALAAINCSYKLLPQNDEKRKNLIQLIQTFKKHYRQKQGFELIESQSPIQSIIIQGNENIKQFAENIRQHGLDVRPILYPTVPRGKERIRICLHSFNTEQEVLKLATVINSL